MQKVIIGGFGGSGKSTLCTLLDGHSKLRVSFLQELFVRVFTFGFPELKKNSKMPLIGRQLIGEAHFILKLKNEKLLVKLSCFKTLLYLHTYYPILESEALSKKTTSECTNQENISLDLKINFSKFEDTWKKELFCKPTERTIEDVMNILYTAWFDSFEYYTRKMSKEDIAVYCHQSEEESGIKLMLKENFNTKYIFMYRPLEDYWAVHIDRLMLDGMTREEAEQKYCKTWRPLNQATLLPFYKKLATERPHQIMMLSIEDVVEKYKETMPKICDFIGIEPEEVLFRPTYCGKEEKSFSGYIGKVNDAGRYKTISSKTFKILQLQQKNPGIFETFFTTDSVIAISYTDLRLKRFMKKVPLKINSILKNLLGYS